MTAYWGTLDGTNPKQQKIGDYASTSIMKEALKKYILEDIPFPYCRMSFFWDENNKCLKCDYESNYKAFYIYGAESVKGELIGNS